MTSSLSLRVSAFFRSLFWSSTTSGHQTMKTMMTTTILEAAGEVRRELIYVHGDPAGWCFESSCRLMERLKKVGIETYLVQGYVQDSKGKPRYHYWLEHDGNILDITGDQFNKYPRDKDIPAVLYEPWSLWPCYLKQDVFNLPAPVQYQWAFDLIPLGA